MAKVKAKKIEVTETLVKESLPEPPQGYSSDVQRVTPQVIKIRLCHDDADYSYTTEKVWSIHGFVKRDVVVSPSSPTTLRLDEPVYTILCLPQVRYGSATQELSADESIIYLSSI